MELLANIASSIFSFLKFTHEVAQSGQKIPVLDMQVGVGPEESNGPWFHHNETDDKLAPGKETSEAPTVEQIQYEFYRNQWPTN